MITIKTLEFATHRGFESWYDLNRKFIAVVETRIPRTVTVPSDVSYRETNRSKIFVKYYEFERDI